MADVAGLENGIGRPGHQKKIAQYQSTQSLHLSGPSSRAKPQLAVKDTWEHSTMGGVAAASLICDLLKFAKSNPLQ